MSALIAGVRFELVIAVCALLISTLATVASWWQTQASWQQTRIIDEQLSAQVWPYVGFSVGIVKADTDEFTIENDGLGPAVVRSVSVRVDGRERSSFVDMLHAVLGPNITRRKAHGESIGLAEDSASPGFVTPGRVAADAHIPEQIIRETTHPRESTDRYPNVLLCDRPRALLADGYGREFRSAAHLRVP